VKQALDESGLKYVQVEDEFGLMFGGDHRDDMLVGVKATGDYLVVNSTLPEFPSRQEETVAHNYLQLTFDSDMYKLIRRPNGEHAITAEIPLCVVSASTLETAIRGVVRLVDIKSGDLLSLDEMKKANLTLNVRTATLLAEHLTAVQESVPGLLRQAGVQPQPVDGGKAYTFKINLGEIEIVLLALSQRGVMSLVAPFGDLKPQGNKLDFYRKMAEANLKMDVCKVALSQEDTVAFMYQIPVPDLASVKKGLERLQIYVPLFALDLGTGSGSSASGLGDTSAPAKKSGCLSIVLAGMALSGFILTVLS